MIIQKKLEGVIRTSFYSSLKRETAAKQSHYQRCESHPEEEANESDVGSGQDSQNISIYCDVTALA